MLIRALKSTTGLPRGCVGEVDDYTGKELIAMGYAIEELPVSKQEAAPIAANDNVEGDGGPLADEAPQTGGQTGVDKQPSLSRRGRPRKMRG